MQLGNFSISALDAYVTSLHEQLSAEAFEALRPQIVALYTAILARPYPDQEEIVLPSHSLYLEALPGTAPVLEDFQLLHRAVDTGRTPHLFRQVV